MGRVVHEIVAELIEAQKIRKDVNLNRLKCSVSQRYGLKAQPKLVDIIAAVPQDYKVGYS